MGPIELAIYVHVTYRVLDFHRKHAAMLAAFRELFGFNYSIEADPVPGRRHGIAPGTALLILGELIRVASIDPRLVHLIRSLFRSAKVACHPHPDGIVIGREGTQLVFYQHAAPVSEDDLKEFYAEFGDQIIIWSLLRIIWESLSPTEVSPFNRWQIRGSAAQDTFSDFGMADWFGTTELQPPYTNVGQVIIQWWQDRVGEVLGEMDLERRGSWFEKLGDAG